MSFNGSGTYVPPAGQPVATNTVISSSVFNTLVTDLGNSLTNTLPRDGQASMSGQLKIIDGTSSVPGIAFNSEAASGIFRPASGMLALTVSGVEGLRLNSSGRVLIGSTTDDATNKLQVTGPVKITGALTATSFVGPVNGTATNVTGVVAIANGGTGATTGAAATTALGAVQQGGGIGQGANKLYLGWGTSGGLRMTIDSTDNGYIPLSTTNPYSGAITFPNPVSAQTLTTTGAVTFGGGATFSSSIQVAGTSNINGPLLSTAGANMSSGLSITNGAFTSAVPIQAQGGNTATLTGNGYVQIGGSAGNNIVMDYNSIQSRNNGAYNSLYLQQNGGNIVMGQSSANIQLAVSGQITATTNITASGNITAGGQINASGTIYAQSASNLKIAMFDSATVRGYIAADSGNCFRTINSANSLYTFSVDNTGNATVVQGLTVGSTISSGGGVFCSTVNATGSVSANGQLSGNGILISKTDNAQIQYQNGSFAIYTRCTNTAGSFEWINNGYSAVLATLTQAGAFTANSVGQTSDERLKANWRGVSANFIESLANLKSGIYDRIDIAATQVGVGAQSLQRFMPEAVIELDSGKLTVNYGGAAMVATVELAKRVIDLESHVAALRRLVDQLIEVKV